MKRFPCLLLAGLILTLPPRLVTGEPFSGGSRSAGALQPRSVELLHHDLAVELTPGPHHILATDRVTLRALVSDLNRLSFSLNPALQVTRIEERSGSGRHPLRFTTEPVQRDAASATLAPGGREQGEGQPSEPDQAIQMVTVSLRAPSTRGDLLTLEWSYEGTLNDPPREPRQLRFVTPSETAGHIGSEGVYLSGETHWYPDLRGALPTARIVVVTPEGWEAVTHGRQVSRSVHDGVAIAEWQVSAKTEALTLVANRFVKTAREWQDPSGRSIEVSAYLFPENAHLSGEYVQASVRYLEFYTKLLGPYPFPKFAVVENFFASGVGMSSFTLLGSGVIKRHYVQPYALGHEIVHSWIGNWVFNDFEQGNWVEGLTTYLANCYYEEATGTTTQAREQRRMMVLGYAVYVSPEDDYPVGRFRTKSDQRDNAIGYQKAAMIFHMLRRQLGDAAFWAALRTLVATHGGLYATWLDLERVFRETGGQDLRWFFAQWVERPGAPSLKIGSLVFHFLADLKRQEGSVFRSSSLSGVEVQQVQGGAPYRLRLPLVLSTSEQAHTNVVEMKDSTETLSLPSVEKSANLQIDPDFHTFRRLRRETLAPMLNLFVTDKERSLAVPGGGTDSERQPYQEMVKQIVSREQQIAQLGDQEAEVTKGSVLVLGGPGVNKAAGWAVRGCEDKVRIEKDSFTIEGRTYEGPSMALLVSCRHPERPEHVVTLFYGVSPAAAAKVARLLFFYGWQSYLVFRDGAVVTRGDFLPVENDLEVRFDVP